MTIRVGAYRVIYALQTRTVPPSSSRASTSAVETPSATNQAWREALPGRAESLPATDSIFEIHALRATRSIISELRATKLGTKFVHRYENFFINY